ncbi:DUF1343 domain-containing protein [Candidatus Fermentibacteria bacterium]|nr:MAG: DUF1343 domain-containing protein [Candidatus Fermentibacteria bacterium]
MGKMRTGLDRIRREMLPGCRIGLLSHYAAVNSGYISALDVLAAIPEIDIQILFGPQHGFRGETQDNMIEWEGYIHPQYGIPVCSLYGRNRKPAPEMLGGLDCLVVDLQDVGTRYYTYIYTMAYCMRACSSARVPVVVLDRPNPLGISIIEGMPLRKGYESFVGLYPIPVRHGLTVGELALLFARLDSLPRPEVIQMDGWDGEGIPDDYQWVYPSPNMPTEETALVYPGMCLLEATNLSEGRGTTRPFSVFGAPWIDGVELCSRLNGTIFLEGAVLRPHAFIPTFNKHAREMCYGAEIHVLDRSKFRPLRTGLGILLESFRYSRTGWNDPPYEYEFRKMPVDILSGGSQVREAVNESDADKLIELACGDPASHSGLTSDILLYEREFCS